jgi:uncharacterized delta-60 repeat protein
MNRLSVALRASGSGRRSRSRLLLAAITSITVAAASACGGGGGHGGGGSARGFGMRGKVRTDFGRDDVANALAIQGDGKIVAAGGTGSDFALARYTRDGRLDPSFGMGGKVVTDVGALPAGRYQHGGAVAVAIQADGKIVAGGGTRSDFVLARYTRDGRLDRSFGKGGKVVTDVGARQSQLFTEPLGAKAIALQSDGKIVAAGAGPRHFALARYTRDGRLDPSFGRGGEVITYVGREDGAEALAVQADGKIVAAGWSDYKFALARYMPDGQLDPSFGRGGKVVNNAGYDDFDIARAVAVEADGKIVAAGSTGPRHFYAVVVRLTPRGALDRSFGSGGIVPAEDRASESSAIAILGDGRMVVGGTENPYFNSPDRPSVNHFALIRYTRNGDPDPTFGHGGSVRTGFSQDRYFSGTALAIQEDGKIVVAGGGGSRPGSRDFLLVRYRPDGSLDR